MIPNRMNQKSIDKLKQYEHIKFELLINPDFSNKKMFDPTLNYNPG